MYDPRDINDRDTSSVMFALHHAGKGLALLPVLAGGLAWAIARHKLAWEPDAWLWLLAGLVGLITAILEILWLAYLWDEPASRKKSSAR